MKNSLKLEAIQLRQQGLSYREILDLVDVRKSTLSLWLRDLILTDEQKARLNNKQVVSRIFGGKARHEKRLKQTEEIIANASQEVGCLSKRDLWLIGVALYWAEGSKEKAAKIGSGAQFTNSDGAMVKLFILWLKNACMVNDKDITYEIYLHDSRKDILNRVKEYWSDVTGRSPELLTKVYYKRTPLKTNRTNVEDTYHGILRVRVRKSSNLNRKIAGWVIGIQHQDWGDQ
jgi:hypothetical protein